MPFLDVPPPQYFKKVLRFFEKGRRLFFVESSSWPRSCFGVYSLGIRRALGGLCGLIARNDLTSGPRNSISSVVIAIRSRALTRFAGAFRSQMEMSRG